MHRGTDFNRRNHRQAKAIAITASRDMAARAFALFSGALLLSLLLLGAGRLIGP